MILDQLASVADFLGLLIVAITLVYLTIRIRGSNAYRAAVGLALMAVFLLVWINLAVGIIGEPDNLANLMYIGVPAIGIIGAIIMRFQPDGMARALYATALAQALVAAITVVAELGFPPTPVRSLLILNGILIAFWIGSASLFRKASLEHTPTGARQSG